MAEYLTLGSAPPEEPCAQTVDADKVKADWRNQLERAFPDARFGLKGFPHDWGTYYEVVVYYGTEREMEIAFQVERELPARWED